MPSVPSPRHAATTRDEAGVLPRVGRAITIHPPTDWHTLDHRQYVVHVDSRRQSPLAFALSVAAGLDARPRRLDGGYLYDDAGSALFDSITAQPEYYLTRAEDRLLAAGARTIRAVAGPSVLVELGSGTSTKTRRLLEAWTAAGPTTYVPVDVDERCLERASATLRQSYPALTIDAVAAGYERALPLMRGVSPMTLVFLGSSLGNLGRQEYPEFCQLVASTLASGDHFLVGVDLVKRPEVLEAAYNDAAGVTARFTRNLFARMNRDLGTGVPLDAIEHVAFYDAARERIEIYAEARRGLVIRIPLLARDFPIAARERILTEVSYKFRPAALVATVERFGFRLAWHDVGDGAFGLFLFRKTSPATGASHLPTSSTPGAAGQLLAETRRRTMDIVAPLDDEDLERQHSSLMSPIAWDLGHIAHFEHTWLARALGVDLPGAEEGDRLYEPLATPRALRSDLPLPSVAAVRARMREVRDGIDENLRQRQCGPDTSAPTSPLRTSPLRTTSGLLEGDLAVSLVTQHEAQHQETMLQAIALREDLEYRPAFVCDDAPAPVASRPFDETILVHGGPFVMGTDERCFAYDNERPAHTVEVPTFRIDRCPVTNGQFVAFMRDGGYARRELWSTGGWDWLQKSGARAPSHWRAPSPSPARHSRDRGHDGSGEASPRESMGEWQAWVFGRLSPIDPDAPVLHVSWYEADAYARWAGGRLPSEAEWEKAALWDPASGHARRNPWGDADWSPCHANLDQRRLEPMPAAAVLAGQSPTGCLQMLGDVWEWTNDWFAGYPGFVSFPYRDYSETFFGTTYKVLRGGSFATRATVARPTFRNWDLPERRQIFAGFRCVRVDAPLTR